MTRFQLGYVLLSCYLPEIHGRIDEKIAFKIRMQQPMSDWDVYQWSTKELNLPAISGEIEESAAGDIFVVGVCKKIAEICGGMLTQQIVLTQGDTDGTGTNDPDSDQEKEQDDRQGPPDRS
jgi:hypothetical protein